MVESIGHDGLLVNGRRLFFEYSSKPTGGAAASQTGQGKPSAVSKSGAAPAVDWVCMCGCVNFARRTVCFQCNEGRVEDTPTGDAKLSATLSVANQTSEPGPTNVLVVRGLDENVDEQILRFEFSKYAPIKDLRLVRDKFTHVSRGFAFVHFHSVEDAFKALEASNGKTIEKNGQVLKVLFAKSSYVTGQAHGNSLAAAAIEAATFAKQYDSTGWTPKEYQMEEGACAEKGGIKESSGKSGETSLLMDSNKGNVAGAEVKTAAHSGFVWDETSGYYYHAASGFYYDGHRGLYYDGNNGIWYTYNQETQEYVPYAEFTTESKVNKTLVNNSSKSEKSSRDPATEKVVLGTPVHSKAVISAPACTITLENDTTDKKSKLAESVAAALINARAAAKKEKEKMKERQKEMRLAGKNPGMGSKKFTNVVTPWKQWKSEDPGSSFRVENTSPFPLASVDVPSNRVFGVGSSVSTITFSKSHDVSMPLREATGRQTNASVCGSGNRFGANHQLSEISGTIRESAINKTITGVIRESGRVTTTSVDAGAVLGCSTVSQPTTSTRSVPIGTGKLSEISGRIIESGSSKTVTGLVREVGRGISRSADAGAVLESFTVPKSTISTPSVSNSTSKVSEISGRIIESRSSKTIAGVIRESGRGTTRSVDAAGAVLGSSIVSQPTTSASSSSIGTSKISEISGSMSGSHIGKTMTGMLRESGRGMTRGVETGAVLVSSTLSQPTTSIPLKTNASACGSYGSMTSKKRRFTEAAQPVCRDRAAESRSSCGSLQSVNPDFALEPMRKGVEAGAIHGLGFPYPRSFDEKSAQTLLAAANLERKSFAAIRGQQAFDERNVGNHGLRSMGWQEGSGLHKGVGIVEPLQLPKAGEGAGFGGQWEHIVEPLQTPKAGERGSFGSQWERQGASWF
ncbi:hypothetical protein O6H91_02G071800 [Diphasiastrum complanatum]|nr:hypothetical protein O6H91_02G071800 [Diphasiastrum complanatum]